MSDTVLLTGISGFLGSHIALQLLEAGYKVRGSVRDLSRSDEVRQTMQEHMTDPSANHSATIDNLEFVTLDLLSDEGWDDAMQGVKYLQHTASPFVTSMPDDEMELIRPAVEGTSRAINAALKAKVKHIVLTSSMAAIMYGYGSARTAPFTEADWTDTEIETNAYVRSKTLAEKKAWELMDAANRHDDLSVINPSFILGPLLNKDAGTSGALVTRFLSGSLPAAPKIGFPCVDVQDVAALHVMAMTAPEVAGKRLVTAANSLSMLEMSEALKKQLPSYAGKLPKFELPNWAVRLYAIFDADARSNLGELGHTKTTDSSNARRLLGRDFITSEAAMAAMGQSLVDHGLV